jgi:hypothetical protein
MTNDVSTRPTSQSTAETTKGSSTNISTAQNSEIEEETKDNSESEPFEIGKNCEANLIQEYGVIHIKNALDEDQQKELWNLTKPYVTDPTGKATGFSNFSVSMHKDA